MIAPMSLITVSLTGVCGFVLPNRDLANAIRVWRFGIALLASFLGLSGIGIGVAVLVVHLLGLKSMGKSYVILFDRTIRRKRMAKDKVRNPRTDPVDKRNQE